MKRCLSVFLWLFIIVFFNNATEAYSAKKADDNAIAAIKETYRKINADVDARKYKTEIAYIESDSTDGGVIMGYYDNGNLKKLYYILGHAKGRTTYEFYIDNQNLVFAFYYNIFYSSSISQPGVMNYEKVTEEKYYFAENKLIKWLNDQEEVNLNSKKIKSTTKKIMDDMNDLLERLKKK